MLKVRVIPTLLLKGSGLVKGQGFDSWRRVGTLLPAVKVYDLRQVDELALLDIEATAAGRDPDYETVADAAAECFVPLAAGGGVRTLDHIKGLLNAGADKVVVGTAALERPSLIDEAAARFGAQCVVVSIDFRRTADGASRCFSRSGTVDAGRDAVGWAVEAARRGAGEILLTSIERDGTMAGYDLDLVRAVASAVPVPVIASGGAGTYDHMAEALASGASAVAAASIFHFTERTPLEAKRHLAALGHPMRGMRPAERAA